MESPRGSLVRLVCRSLAPSSCTLVAAPSGAKRRHKRNRLCLRNLRGSGGPLSHLPTTANWAPAAFHVGAGRRLRRSPVVRHTCSCELNPVARWAVLFAFPADGERAPRDGLNQFGVRAGREVRQVTDLAERRIVRDLATAGEDLPRHRRGARGRCHGRLSCRHCRLRPQAHERRESHRGQQRHSLQTSRHAERL